MNLIAKIQNIQAEIAKEVIKEEVLGKNELKVKIYKKQLIAISDGGLYSLLNGSAYDYLDKNDTSYRNQVIELAGRVFLCIFTVECALKVIAQGLVFHRNAYLRDGWNWLDFLVVVVGWLEAIPNVPGLRALRTLRVLRPLRSINAIPSMKNQITSLISSFGQLVNVLLFLMFLFIIFGILGVQLYQGQSYQRCRLTPEPDEFGNWPIDPNQNRACQYNGSAGWYYCNAGTYCGAPSDFGLSLANENLTLASDINYGITTFDNLAVGMLTIFQSLTLEGWSDIMYMFMDSGTPWLGGTYFVVLVFIGSFFLFNIILVVIITNYVDTKTKQKAEAEKLRREQAKAHDRKETTEEHAKVKPEETQQPVQTADKGNDNDDDMRSDTKYLGNPFSKQKDKETFIEVLKHSEDQSPPTQLREQAVNLSKHSSDEEKDQVQMDPMLPHINLNEKKLRSTFYDLDWGTVSKVPEDERKNQVLESLGNKSSKSNDKKPMSPQQLDKSPLADLQPTSFIVIPKSESIMQEIDMRPLQDKSKSVSTARDSKIHVEEGSIEELYVRKPLRTKCKHFWKEVKEFFYVVCTSSLFNLLIMVMILLNTIVLAMDRYPQDPVEDNALNQINNFLTWMFFGEMIIKLIGLTPKIYVKDKFNIFDAIVTTLTIAENILDLSASNSISTGGAISGLRAVRLFRIFKLARSFKSFQEMLSKIYLSIGDIGNFSILLFLFLFTYTLFGQQMLAGKIKFDNNGNVDLVNGQSVRDNFDTFAQGFISIFLVLIGDNWNNDMYNAMLCNGNSYAIFYIVLQVFGKYVLLNLFLAIILENFEDNPDDILQIQNDPSDKPKKKSFTDKLKAKAQGCKQYVRDLFTFKKTKVGIVGSLDLSQVQNSQQQTMNDNTLKPIAQSDNVSQRSNQKNSYSNRSPRGDLEKFKSFDKSTVQFERQFTIDKVEEILSSPNKLKKMKSIKSDPSKFEFMASNNKMSLTSSKFFPGGQPQFEPSPQVQGSQYQTENDEFYLDGGGSNRELLMKKQTSTFSKRSGKKKNLMEDLINPEAKIKAKTDIKLSGRSLFIFSKSNPIRQFFKKIISHRYFDPFILFLIIFSTLLLTIDSPLDDPNGNLQVVLGNIDIVVTTLFSCEAALKIVVYGFLFNGEDSYLRNSWNIMDIIIVIFSILSIALSSLNIQFIKVIRMLRVLRPLRMISRNEGLKIAVLSLINAVHGIVNASIISLIFFILFGIFAVNQFKGKLYYCYDQNVQTIFDNPTIITKWDCLNMGGDWVNEVTTFDNILISMLSLFVMTTTEGWEVYMYYGMDSVAIDYNPQYDNNIGWAYFFIVFMIVGCEFVLNLFVSIIVNTFDIEKEKLSQNHLLSKYQKQWILAQSLCFNEQPIKVQTKKTTNRVSLYCQKFVEHPYFDGFIIMCIILNTISMTINWYESPAALGPIMDEINYFFTAIFTLEAIIKIIAFKTDYFKQGWNIFDFVIVLISYITLVIGLASSASIGPKQATIARAFRIGRVFRLIKKAKFLRIIFNTIIFTLPSLANIGALLILLLFIFSILGMQLFATVQLQDTLNQHKNFQNFQMSFLTLIVIQTGEGWNFVMEDCARTYSIVFQCNENPTYDSIQANGGIPNGCGSPLTSFFYHFAFQLIVSIIFLNLFIAVILQGFTSSNEEEELDVHRKQSHELKDIWKKYDPDGIGFINVSDLDLIIDELEEKSDLLRTSIKKDPIKRRHFISSLQVPTYFKFTKYYFQDILSCLIKKYLQHEYVIEELKALEIEDPHEYIHFYKEFEDQFEDVVDDIAKKSKETKIQMVEKNFKERDRYSRKMVTRVDKFHDKVFDSSYVVWVPIIKERLKPFLRKLKEKKRIQNMSLIMETGGQLDRRELRRANDQDDVSENSNNFQSNGRLLGAQIQQQNNGWSNSLNVQKIRTGEIGGTNAISQGDESYEQEQDYEAVVREELNQGVGEQRHQ